MAADKQGGPARTWDGGPYYRRIVAPLLGASHFNRHGAVVGLLRRRRQRVRQGDGIRGGRYGPRSHGQSGFGANCGVILDKRPIEAIAREIRYEPLPDEIRAVIIASWRRGGLLPAATIEQMVPAAPELRAAAS